LSGVQGVAAARAEAFHVLWRLCHHVITNFDGDLKSKESQRSKRFV